MNELLTVVASGLAAASFYITYGLGLALVYRSTGISTSPTEPSGRQRDILRTRCSATACPMG